LGIGEKVFPFLKLIRSWGQLSFQDSNSPLMEELSHLHDYINLILFFILIFVGVIIFFRIQNALINQKLVQIQIVEWVWTVIPAFLLLQIALPRLLLLYILDESANSSLVVKAVGHQWYWRYEYNDFFILQEHVRLEIDSYIIPTNELEDNIFRLLDVDNRTVLPINLQTRILIRSVDVLHSWTVPSLGVKADAVPGRLNQLKFSSHRPGLFFGQCSEICGANHSFIPIVVEIVNVSTFYKWLLRNE
jgi:cytochrome c oxidase subunit 2